MSYGQLYINMEKLINTLRVLLMNYFLKVFMRKKK